MIKLNSHGYFELENKPTKEALSEYYSSKYFQQEKGPYRLTYSEEERRYFINKIEQKHLQIATSVPRLASGAHRLLDIGSGEGFAMKYFKDLGWEVCGLDYGSFGCETQNPDCLDQLVVGDVYESINRFRARNETFDVVWMGNILEHVLDPMLLLNIARDLCVPGGALMVLVPNDCSILQSYLLEHGMIDKAFWIVHPDHISYFNPTGLRNLCAAAGWEPGSMVTDYPIDLMLLNSEANYIKDATKGKAAHRSRLAFENLIHEVSPSLTNELYEAMCRLGIGRQISAVFLRPVTKYFCLRTETYAAGPYHVCSIRREDIERIKDWRNEQMDVLRQSALLTAEAQEAYFRAEIWPSFSEPRPKQILLSFFKNEELIGYGGLVHISWMDQRAEVSFLLDTPRTKDSAVYREDFLAFLGLIKSIAFQELHLRRLWGETYNIRPRHIRILEEGGFKLEGRMRGQVVINGRPTDSLLHGLMREEYKEHKSNITSARIHGNVLVTSIAKKVPLLKAVRRAIDKLGPGRLFGGDMDGQCVGRYFVDEFWEMPRLAELDETALLQYLEARRIHAVIPTRDGELLYWAKMKSTLAGHGVHVMVSSPQAVELCVDKLAFARQAVTLGVPVIPTHATLDTCGPGPLVVKERYGAGSRNMGLNLSRTAAMRHAAQLQHPIYQPMVHGKEFSADAYVDRKGNVKGVVLRTRDKVVEGESQVTTVFESAKLEEACRRWLDKMGLYGHVVVQALEDADGNPHVIECNPRFGGASTLGVAAGLDSFYWYLLEARGNDLGDYPFMKSAVALRQVRFPEDVVLEA